MSEDGLATAGAEEVPATSDIAPATIPPVSEVPEAKVPTFAAFHSRDYSILTILRVCSGAGENMLATAVGWQVYYMTDSTFLLGVVGLILFVPRFLFILPAGQLADRFDKRYMACMGLCIETLAAGGLLAMSLVHVTSIPLLLALVFCTTSGSTLAGPSLRSIIPRLVPREHLPNAMNWNSATTQITVVGGPMLAGFLYGLGVSLVYGPVCVLLAIAACCPLLMRLAPTTAPPMGNGLEGVLSGLRFVFARPVILAAISLDLFAVLFGGATALLPVFAKTILDVGPFGLGVLRASPAVGAVIATLLLAFFPVSRAIGKKMLFAVVGFGLCTVLFGLSKWVPLSMLALAGIGGFDAVSVFIRATLVQIRTPDEMRGRVGAVHQLFVGTSNQLGEAESGFTATWFGTVPAVVIGGVGTILVVAAWAMKFRDLRNADKFEEPAA